MVLGHNGRIAWGMTTTGGDTSDVFVERSLPGDPDRYRAAEGEERFASREETIQVKGGAPVTLRVRTSRHGPVISDILPRAGEPASQAIALAHPALAEDDHTVDALYRVNHARSWEEFKSALALFDAPEQNVGYAGPDGIGLIAAGRVPRRTARPAVPIDGTTGEYDWQGWIPFEDLPMAHDPPSGRIVNANNAVIDESYPYFLGRDFDAPYRARRIAGWIESKDKLSPLDMAALQHDARSTMAEDLLPAMLATIEARPDLGPVLYALASWDGSVVRSRPEPLIFTAWWRELTRALFADTLAGFADEVVPMPAVVKRALAGGTTWCGARAPASRGSCAALVADALERALIQLRLSFGPDFAAWEWGRVHSARFVHPILGRVPVIGGFFRFEIPTDGDNWTVSRGTTRLSDPADPYGHVHGAGVRAVYDLADLDRSLFSMALGESGNPFSSHFADLLVRWRDGPSIMIPREPRRPTRTLSLTPPPR
jgi:penicillin amidase